MRRLSAVATVFAFCSAGVQWKDPRTGVRNVQREQFSRTEPDPSLFRAPAGYTVKNIRETLKQLEERLNEIQN